MTIKRLAITDHVQQQTFDRIAKMHIRDFVEAVKRGTSLIPAGDSPWAIKVLKGQTVLGYAVGRGGNWSTTLRGDMIPAADSKIINVKA